MRVRVVNYAGGSDVVEIRNGANLDELLREFYPDIDDEEAQIYVNHVRVARNTELNDGDMIVITPKKIVGG